MRRSSLASQTASADPVVVFSSALGWMGLLGSADTVLGSADAVRQLTIGHASPAAALRAVNPSARRLARDLGCFAPLVARLQAYAEGACDDFLDVQIELENPSPFQQRVIERCRTIEPGETISYSQLAEAVGAPRAARAVGAVMAANRIALVVPCHRVVRADGGLGGYSAGEGIALKRRLLRLEQASKRVLCTAQANR